MARPAYASLRIVTIIEIDSLPNLVTNTGSRPTATPECDTMMANGNYVNGVGYALAQLGDIPNVYNYIDIGHHGWLGWDDNFRPFADVALQAANANGATPADVHGFIANTANYSALREPFFTANTVVGGRPVREATTWVDWNRYVDELSFAQAFRNLLAGWRFDDNLGMLIDTSRNGWGGSARPDRGEHVDRPEHVRQPVPLRPPDPPRQLVQPVRCRASASGRGRRRQPASTRTCGSSRRASPTAPAPLIENDEGKGFDRMCDPTYTGNPRNQNNMSGALANAPLSGHWFPAQFQQLMANAFPPL